MIPFRFVFADLRRYWVGSLAIVLLVAFASALGILVNMQERAFRLGTARAADRFDLVVGAAGSEAQLVLSAIFLQPAPLPLMSGSVLKQLGEDPRVAWVAPVGLGDSFEGYPIIGTTAVIATNDGRQPLAEGRLFAGRNEAVIGAGVDLKMGDGVKPMHGLAGSGGHTHKEITYSVVGRMAVTGSAWDRAILVPIEAVWRIHGLEPHESGHAHHHDHGHDESGHDHESEAEVRPVKAAHHDEGSVEKQAKLGGPWGDIPPAVPAVIVKPRTLGDAYALRQQYRKETTQALFPAEVLTRVYTTLGDARFALTILAVGVQLLICVAVILISIIHLTQRRRQIAALRAFGAPRLAIAATVWFETMLLIGCGIVAGVGLGILAANRLSAMITHKTGVTMPVELVSWDIGFALLLAAMASVVALAPAWFAYRQPVADVLRGNG